MPETKGEANLQNKMRLQRALISAMASSDEACIMRWIETYGETFKLLWEEKPKPGALSFSELGHRWLIAQNPNDQQDLIARLEQRHGETTLPRAA